MKEKQDHYLNNGTTLNYNQCAGSLVKLKRDDFEWLKEVNSQTLQQSLKNLETAYGNFFRKHSKFPKFKKKSNHQSFRIPQHISLKEYKICVPKFKEGIKINLHRKLEGKIKSATFSKTPSGKYFVSILCEVHKKTKPKTGKSIGIDLGITDFIVTSDGEKIKNPNFNRHLKPQLKRHQQHLSRKTKGSNRYNKQRVKVVRIYEKITNSRKDFQHKLSTRLINEYDHISLETLAVKNMMRNKHLSYSIADSGWSQFTKMLEYKALWYDKTVTKIDRWYPSSKTCSSCDYIVDKLPLSVRKWTCPKCDENHDRDINAAKNILRQGINLVNSPERCLTNVEMEALTSGNTGETAICEALKKKSQTRLKPVGSPHR